MVYRGLFVALVSAQALLPQCLDEADARHLPARTGFMPSPAEVQPWAGLSPQQAVDRLLADARQARKVHEAPAFTGEPIAMPLGKLPDDAARKEMLDTRTPLAERMVLFWHNLSQGHQPRTGGARALRYHQLPQNLNTGEEPMQRLQRLTLAGLLSAVAGAASAQAYPPPQNVVALATSANLEVTKDLLTVTLNATRDGADASTVQTALKQVLDTALTEAKKAIQPGALEVRTGNFALYPRYSRDGRISGWQGNAELVLEGKDTQRVAQTAGKLQGMNITNVGYSLSRELREKHEAAVTADAIRKFQAKAAEVAKQFGFGTYTLREVNVQASEPGFTPMPRMMSMAKAAEAADAALPVEPGKGNITVTVSGSVVLAR